MPETTRFFTAACKWVRILFAICIDTIDSRRYNIVSELAYLRL
jgi:hypothetical protein